ncbi:MAG: hypothetical protein Q9226_002257 [Calogaya cf. arnoldii]
MTEVFRRSGWGKIVDQGKRNPLGRYAIARYKWHKREKRRYDYDGEPPRAITICGDIPVIPVTFLELHWPDDDYPQGCRRAEYAYNKYLLGRLPSLVICDMFPVECIRQPHARFILPFELLPKDVKKVKRGKKIQLENGIINQYHTSEDELAQAIMGALKGTLRTSLGTIVENLNYAVKLKDLAVRGVLGYSTGKKIDI